MAGVLERSFEQRLDEFAGTAKDATLLAAKVRTSFNTLAENARAGSVSAAPGQLTRLSETLAALTSALGRLAEESGGLRGQHALTAEYAQELGAALMKKGVAVSRGPHPYWLAYPAWFKIEQNSKGAIEVTLNGDKLASMRPTAVADAIAERVSGNFNAKQFTQLLVNVRGIFLRGGATESSLRLDDVYEVLALEAGKPTASRKDFTKNAFYYSVHRLAEELDRAPAAAFKFPPSDRGLEVFFTRDGESRRYLTVEFVGTGLA